MKARTRWAALLALPLIVAAASGARHPAPAPARSSALLPRFPDFGFMVASDEYDGRVFKLSQDYPATRPAIEPAVARILAIDFTKDWRAYMNAVRDYAFEGNIHGGPVGNDFYLEDNKVRRWYHVPWQHAGPSGREGIHGLTAEGPVFPKVLAPSQVNRHQAFAVGFYNSLGGWMIGRVWANANDPDIDVIAKNGFPVGTVVAKLLFTDTPVSEAPFLTNPVQWNAYAFSQPWVPGIDKGPPPPHRMQQLRLIQMDIMVRDDRAKATGGWVFGTYVYNGAMARPNLWENLVPVGLSWGNDPQVTSMKEGNPAPVKTITNPDLKQTIINPDAKELPPQHLGFGLRLSGPVDNTLSSCQSCHMTAQYPAISPILAFSAKGPDGKNLTPNDPLWMRWFRNIPVGQSFDPQARNTDNSLQMAGGIQNFVAARAAATGGLYNVQYWQGHRVKEIYGQRGAQPADAK